jgi:hypothetical protein
LRICPRKGEQTKKALARFKKIKPFFFILIYSPKRLKVKYRYILIRKEHKPLPSLMSEAGALEEEEPEENGLVKIIQTK